MWTQLLAKYMKPKRNEKKINIYPDINKKIISVWNIMENCVQTVVHCYI